MSWEKTKRTGPLREGDHTQRPSPQSEVSTEEGFAQPPVVGSLLGLGPGASPVELGMLERKIQQRQSHGGRASVPNVSLPYLDAIQRFFEGGGTASMGTESRSETAHVHQAATHGISGAAGRLPYLDEIQRSFGRHDVSHIKAHTDSQAAAGAQAMAAEAFTAGEHVAFAGTPSLRTAAHEAAHVIQQRAGVQLKGGVGEACDPYERHANAVADAVVQGQSSEALLDPYASPGPTNAGSRGAIQCYVAPTDMLDYIALGIDLAERGYIEIAFDEGEVKDLRRLANSFFLALDLVLAALPGAGGGGLAVRASPRLAVAGWEALPSSAKTKVIEQVAKEMGWSFGKTSQALINLMAAMGGERGRSASKEATDRGGGRTHKYAGKKVHEILREKKASIRNAPLDKGAPSWNEILDMEWEAIEAAAKDNQPGFGTIKKLLTDGRFNR